MSQPQPLNLSSGIALILQKEGYRLSEIIRAAFGNTVSIEIKVDNVEPVQLKFIHDCNPDSVISKHHAQFDGDGFKVVICDDTLPF